MCNGAPRLLVSCKTHCSQKKRILKQQSDLSDPAGWYKNQDGFVSLCKVDCFHLIPSESAKVNEFVLLERESSRSQGTRGWDRWSELCVPLFAVAFAVANMPKCAESKNFQPSEITSGSFFPLLHCCFSPPKIGRLQTSSAHEVVAPTCADLTCPNSKATASEL